MPSPDPLTDCSTASWSRLVAGIRSGAGPQDYSASKAAVINLANTSAQALAGTGIRVVRHSASSSPTDSLTDEKKDLKTERDLSWINRDWND